MPADRDLREDGPTSTPQDAQLPRGKSATPQSEGNSPVTVEHARRLVEVYGPHPAHDRPWYFEWSQAIVALDAECESLRASLREAGQYEQVGWLSPEGRYDSWGRLQPHEADGCIPLYRKSTEAKEQG